MIGSPRIKLLDTAIIGGGGVGTAITWDIDATDGRSYPQSAATWTDFIAYHSLSAPVPDHLHLCQEASGNLIDVIGADDLIQGGTGHTYENAVSGLSRLGVIAVNSATYWSSTAYNPASTSQFTLMIISHSVATNRYFYQYGNNANIATRVYFAGNSLTVVSSGGVSGAASPSGLHPVGAQHDRTDSSGAWVVDPDQKVVTTRASPSLAQTTVGGIPSAGTTVGTMVYIARWIGADAEAMTPTVVKAMLQAMGWTITYTP